MALVRAKNLLDNKVVGEDNKITYLFLALAGCKAIKTITVIELELEDLTFSEILDNIRKFATKNNGYHRQDKVSNEQTSGEWNNNTVSKQEVRSIQILWVWKFGIGEMTIEDELILLILIEGMFCVL